METSLFSCFTGDFPKLFTHSLCQVFTIPWNEAYLLGYSINSPASSRCPMPTASVPNEVFGLYNITCFLAHYQKEISEGVFFFFFFKKFPWKKKFTLLIKNG